MSNVLIDTIPDYHVSDNNEDAIKEISPDMEPSKRDDNRLPKPNGSESDQGERKQDNENIASMAASAAAAITAANNTRRMSRPKLIDYVLYDNNLETKPIIPGSSNPALTDGLLSNTEFQRAVFDNNGIQGIAENSTVTDGVGHWNRSTKKNPPAGLSSSVTKKSPDMNNDSSQIKESNVNYRGRPLISEGFSRPDIPPRIDTQSIRRGVSDMALSSSPEVIINSSDVIRGNHPGEELLVMTNEAQSGEPITGGSKTLAPKELKRITQRFNAIEELLNTEKTYVNDLETLYKNYLTSIENAECVTREDGDLLLRNIVQIHWFQSRFEALLNNAYKSSFEFYGDICIGNLKALAECFVDHGREFEIYMEYCVHHDHALSVYHRLLNNNNAFRDLVKKLNVFAKLSFASERLRFEDYFILPFQRIFRYKLLLENISKTTDSEDDSYALLIKAQEIFHGIAEYINNEKSKLDTKRKTLLFLSRMNSEWSLSSRWFDYLGSCTLIGTLDVRYINTNKSKRMGCALFKHYMIITKPKNQDAYEPKYWYSLRKCSVKDIPSAEGSLTHCWKLSNEDNILEFGAICSDEKKIWIDSLKENIDLSIQLHLKNGGAEETMLEQLFISSFDTRNNKQLDSADSKQLGEQNSNRYSQSIIMRKMRQNLNRLSYPLRDNDAYILTHATTPSYHGQTSFIDVREYFANSVIDLWSHKKGFHYHNRCKIVDNKYEDVSTTPILRVRKKFFRYLQSSKNGRTLSCYQPTASSLVTALDKITPGISNPYASGPSSSGSVRSNKDFIAHSGLNNPKQYNVTSTHQQSKPILYDKLPANNDLEPLIQRPLSPTHEDLIKALIKNDPLLLDTSTLVSSNMTDPSIYLDKRVDKLQDSVMESNTALEKKGSILEKDERRIQQKERKKFFSGFFKSNEKKK